MSTAGAHPSPGRIELAADPPAELGEGPLWEEHRGQLLWLGLTGVLQFYELDTGTDQSVNLGRMLSSLVADGQGGIIVTASGGLYQFCGNGRLRWLIRLGESRPCGVPNGSCCGPAGDLWVGITTVDEVAGAGSPYQASPELDAIKVVSGLTAPTGIDGSLEWRIMYFADSREDRIEAFQFDPASGWLGKRSKLASLELRDSAPEVLTVGAERCIWVALWGGWPVRGYRPDGQLDLLLEVPVDCVSSCGFGGSTLRDLYVTTASTDLDASGGVAQPATGGLFLYLAPVAGRPVRPFRLRGQGPLQGPPITPQP